MLCSFRLGASLSSDDSPHLKNDPLRNSPECLLYKKPLFFLVRCGADTKIANKAGESAYDLAVKSGNDSIIEKFTTNLGQELLQKLTKTKTPS
jgi:ankyrin repeat protein